MKHCVAESMRDDFVSGSASPTMSKTYQQSSDIYVAEKNIEAYVFPISSSAVVE